MIKMVRDNYDDDGDDGDIDDRNTWAMVRVAAWAIFLLGQRNAWHSNVSFLVITRNYDGDDGDDDGDDDDRDDKYGDDGGDKDVAFQSLISGGCVLFINIITSIIKIL